MRTPLRIALASVLALAPLAIAPATAHADDLTCRGTIANRSWDGDVVVPAGASCTLNNVRVDGNVKSYGRSQVTINAGSVKGNVQAEGSRTVTVNGTTVDGSVQVENHNSVRVLNAHIDGNIQLEQGGQNVVERNRVNSDVQLFSNTGSQRVFDNTIDGNLQCKSNRHGVSGWGNRVSGNAEDQCRNLIPRYLDVATSNQFFNEITWAGKQRITTGYDDGTYRPLDDINRDAMAAFLYRAAGSPNYTPPSRSPFKDVSTSQMFYKEMAWVKEKGISTGWPDGTYRPLQPINRDAMAAFLYRAAGSPSYTAPGTSPFKDVARGQQFYKEMAWVKAKGISTGWTDGTYRPLSQVKRDAMAAFLYRAR
ncbi:MAG: S-layer homology domain-containing protein [Propionibacteriaceae bacterium]|nr:S-layer homology domain-containing protein [Propionibacteriaceae bacterium]